MKLHTEFPGVYRVRAKHGTIGMEWHLEALRLGVFTYRWKRIARWWEAPTLEKISAALEEHFEPAPSTEPYFVTSSE